MTAISLGDIGVINFITYVDEFLFAFILGTPCLIPKHHIIIPSRVM